MARIPGFHGRAPGSTRWWFPKFGAPDPHYSHLCIVQVGRGLRWCFHRYNPGTEESHTLDCSLFCCSGSAGSSTSWGEKLESICCQFYRCWTSMSLIQWWQVPANLNCGSHREAADNAVLVSWLWWLGSFGSLLKPLRPPCRWFGQGLRGRGLAPF